MKLYYYVYEKNDEYSGTIFYELTQGFLVEHALGYSEFQGGYHKRDYLTIDEFKNSYRGRNVSNVEIVELV